MTAPENPFALISGLDAPANGELLVNAPGGTSYLLRTVARGQQQSRTLWPG